ncbi:MAG: HAD family hydrolase [Phascolarctobacterium sp.]|nr:HAD family hydrolase [Candidatus Phascolarctobacterium caballi]
MIYLFDVDGTLIDSSKRHTILLSNLLYKEDADNKRFVLSDYLEYKSNGFGTYDYLTYILHYDVEYAKNISQEWVKHIEDELLIQYDCLYSDTITTLEKLKNNKIFYVSGRQNEKLLFAELERFNLLKYACKVVVTNPSLGAKDKIEKIKLLNLHGKQIVVGDTEADYDTAKCLGIDYYILNRGFRNKDFWDKREVASHKDLSEILVDLSKV